MSGVPSSPRPTALVTAPMRGTGFELLQALADVVYDPWIEQRPLRLYNSEQLAERAATEGASVLVVEADSVKGPVFDLPLVAVASTRGDPNTVDVPAPTAAGVPVLHAPGRNADAVAEMAVALLFAVNRHLLTADADVRNGRVFADGLIPYQRFRAWELKGRTAGIVGLGAVGRALAWRLEGLGLQVISYDPFNPDATHSLDDLLAQSDVVSMHAPVLPDTIGMISAEQFGRMREGAVFLNTARAALHDTDALVAALQSGHLAGAGLDHFEGEHLPVDHPLVAMANVVLAPHIGGATYDTEARQSTLIAEDLERLLAGEAPVRIVNPEVLK
jgi:D-3-phosphoglycerate dehydrogenase